VQSGAVLPVRWQAVTFFCKPFCPGCFLSARLTVEFEPALVLRLWGFPVKSAADCKGPACASNVCPTMPLLLATLAVWLVGLADAEDAWKHFLHIPEVSALCNAPLRTNAAESWLHAQSYCLEESLDVPRPGQQICTYGCERTWIAPTSCGTQAPEVSPQSRQLVVSTCGSLEEQFRRAGEILLPL
jgi:hypothetical protein